MTEETLMSSRWKLSLYSVNTQRIIGHQIDFV